MDNLRVCRWCGIFLRPDDITVGFGNGTGNDYAHPGCYDEFKVLYNSVVEYDNGAIEIFDRLVERIKTLHKALEDQLNR